MFTIEHEFDATVITLVDDGADLPLQEDVVIAAFEDCVTLEQFDPRQAAPVRLVLSLGQVRDLAAALNLRGTEALFGRNWGCSIDHPCLHFELCYYMAIDFAIAHSIARVEAGAQGEHKISRGYLPVATYSAHHISHPGLRAAVADFLARERPAIRGHIAALAEASPFRSGNAQA